MLDVWMLYRTQAIFTSTKLVVLREPKSSVLHPPQAANFVDVSHLTQLHSSSRQFVGCLNKTTEGGDNHRTNPSNAMATGI